MFLYSFDPGQVTGIAIWSDSGELLLAESVHIGALVRWLRKQEDLSRSRAVIEIPNHLKRSLDDIVKCAVRAGEIGGHFANTEYVTPTTWKGNVPKRVSEARSRARLTRNELQIASKADHNCWDAIGIGLWYWKRN